MTHRLRPALYLLAAFWLAALPASADLRSGQRAPAFTLERFGGGKTSLADLKGKVALLAFWQPRCSSCNEMIPHLQQLDRKYSGSGARVIGIAELKPSAEEIREFLDEHPISYPVLLDRNSTVTKRYGVAQHPTTVIIDRKGIVRFMHTGFLKGEERRLDEALQAVLGGKRIARRGLDHG